MRRSVRLYVGLVALAVVSLAITGSVVFGSLQRSSFAARGGSLVVAQDIPSMVRMSEVIVVGTVLGPGGTRNLARDPRDLSREDPNLTVTGQDFVVAVEMAIKGSVAQTITVTSAKSSVVRKGLLVGEHEYQNFIPLTTGTRYALMLKTVHGAPGVYATALEPSRFELGAGATVRSNWNEAKTLFPVMSTDAFINALKAEVASGTP